MCCDNLQFILSRWLPVVAFGAITVRFASRIFTAGVSEKKKDTDTFCRWPTNFPCSVQLRSSPGYIHEYLVFRLLHLLVYTHVFVIASPNKTVSLLAMNIIHNGSPNVRKANESFRRLFGLHLQPIVLFHIFFPNIKHLRM